MTFISRISLKLDDLQQIAI